MREMQVGIDLFVAARESFVISVHFRSADGGASAIRSGGGGAQRDTRSSYHIGKISAHVNAPPRNNISLATCERAEIRSLK